MIWCESGTGPRSISKLEVIFCAFSTLKIVSELFLSEIISLTHLSCLSGLGSQVQCKNSWWQTIAEMIWFRHREFVCLAAGKQGSNNAMILKKTTGAELGGHRLDEALSTLFEALSKSEARRIIDRGGCAVNSSMVRVASRLVKAGDIIEVGVMDYFLLLFHCLAPKIVVVVVVVIVVRLHHLPLQ